MSTESIWDSGVIDEPEESKFVKFSEIGDSVAGVITKLSTHTFPADDANNKPAKTVPQLTIAAGDDEVVLTASQTDLLRKLIALRPAVGAEIRVAYVGDKGRMKVFKVDVKSDPGF